MRAPKGSVRNITWGLACVIDEVDAAGHAVSKTSFEGSNL
jgi:hypothetical protein